MIDINNRQQQPFKGQNDHLSGINGQLSRNGVLQCSMLEWCLTWTK